MTRSVGIHDGRTEEFRIMQKTMEQMIADSGKKLQMDDFIYQGNDANDKINDYLEKWRLFPGHRYLINYLYSFLFYCESESDARIHSLYEEIDHGKTLSEGSEEVLEELADRLLQKIDEIGRSDLRAELADKYTKDVIRRNLIHPAQDFFLLFLAPICDFDADVVEFFLTRVFKRDRLCNYIPNEYLLKLSMELFEQGLCVEGCTMDILYELTLYYDSLGNLEESIEIPKDIGTTFITQKSRIQLESRGESFQIENYVELQELLQWYKELKKPSERNRELVYRDILSETVHLYEEEMNDYLRMVKNRKIRPKQRHREEMSVAVNIWYDSKKINEPLCLSSGTRFFGKNCEYVFLDHESLEYSDYVKVCLHVVPHEDNSDRFQPAIKAVPEGSHFEIVSGNIYKDGKPVIKDIRALSLKAVNARETANINPEVLLNSSLWARPKWRREDYSEGHCNAFVVMDVMVGEQLPEDILFEYQGFKYIPNEGMGISWYPKKTISVQLDVDQTVIGEILKESRTVKGKKVNNYVIEPVGSIKKMEPALPVITEIKNEDRVIVPAERFVESKNGDNKTLRYLITHESDIDVSDDMEEMGIIPLFRKYMYAKADYTYLTNLDIETVQSLGLNVHNLSSEWLKDSMILGDETWFSSLDAFHQRSVVLVLLFMLYAKKYAQEDISRERFLRNFRRYINNQMDKLRFDELYLGYPLDCLLVFLLSFCENADVCDILRILYKEIGEQEG